MNKLYLIEKFFGTKAAVTVAVVMLLVAMVVIGIGSGSLRLGSDEKGRREAENYVASNRAALIGISEDMTKCVSEAASKSGIPETDVVLFITPGKGTRDTACSFESTAGSLTVPQTITDKAKKIDTGKAPEISTFRATGSGTVLTYKGKATIICTKESGGSWEISVK